MAEGQLDFGGIERFTREGGSLQERSVEFPGKSFEDKYHELIANGAAEEIAQKYKFGKVVAELLETHDVDDLTPAVCESFLFSHPEFSGYHPALVLAVAKNILAEREAQEALRNIKH